MLLQPSLLCLFRMSLFIATRGQGPNDDILQLSQNVASDLVAELTSLI